MKQSFKILMVGPDRLVCGGITTLVSLYAQQEYFQKNILYVPLYLDAPFLAKLVRFVWALLKIAYLLKTDKQIRLVHIHVSDRGSLLRKGIVLLIAKAFTKKIILHFHAALLKDEYHNYPKIFQSFIKMILTKADAIIALGENNQRFFAGLLPVSSNTKVWIIPNAIKNIPRVKTKNTSSKFLRVVFAGKIGQRKGAYDVLKIAESLRESHRFYVYGDGEREKLQKKIKDLNLTNIVKHFDWTDPKIFLSKADVFFLPTYFEGMPLAILEAMSYGLPIISTTAGEISSIVKDKRNGYVFSPGDVQGMIKCLEQLSTHREKLHLMGNASLALSKQYAIDKVFRKLVVVYEKLLKTSNL